MVFWFLYVLAEDDMLYALSRLESIRVRCRSINVADANAMVGHLFRAWTIRKGAPCQIDRTGHDRVVLLSGQYGFHLSGIARSFQKKNTTSLAHQQLSA